MAADLSGLWIALAAMTGASLPTYVTARQRRRDKQQDWDREDEVARRAEVAADKVAQAATDLVESNKAVAEAALLSGHIIDSKLDTVIATGDKVHTLVNSNMTRSMKGELAATIALVELLREREPNEETLKKIATAEASIVELEASLSDRTIAQAEVEAQDGS